MGGARSAFVPCNTGDEAKSRALRARDYVHGFRVPVTYHDQYYWPDEYE